MAAKGIHCIFQQLQITDFLRAEIFRNRLIFLCIYQFLSSKCEFVIFFGTIK